MAWRDIVGYEGRYEVSDLGEVRNVKTGRVLRSQQFSNKYMLIRLGRNSRSHLVHRLVATAFVPGDVTLQVNHKNGVRDDNRAINLEWVTCSENHKHSYDNLTRKKHAWTKPVFLVKGENSTRFESINAAARQLGVDEGSVSSAVRNGHKCRGYEVVYG